MELRAPVRWSLRVVAATSFAVALVGLSASSAQARPTTSWTNSYFSDPELQNWVGEVSLFCDGSRTQYGTTSAYGMRTVTESCNSSGEPMDDKVYWCFILQPGGPIRLVDPAIGCH